MTGPGPYQKIRVVEVKIRDHILGHWRRRMLNNMGSFGILRRWISRSKAVGILSDYNLAGSFRSLNSACGGESATLSNKPSGWPPRLLSAVVSGGGGEIVGCSHGWIAVFNKRNNNNLCLSDPVSHRSIKLPPIHSLPDPNFNLDLEGQGSVTKVILSSSPDDDDCRAMMTFGPANRLAFCVPGRSSEWSLICDHFFEYDHAFSFRFTSIAKVQEDLVYCSRRKLFTSITAAHLDLYNLYFKDSNFYPTPERHDWDIQDPNSPEIVGSEWLGAATDPDPNTWLEENIELLANECVQIPHLVYAEESDHLYIVIQFVRLMSADGRSPLGFVPICELKGLNGVFSGKTFGFVVVRLNEEDLKENRKREMHEKRSFTIVNDLNGMSMFVGINHSFAISASDDHEFKPNAIYFSDAKRLPRVCCAYDSGVFDYATKTISPIFDY